MGFLSKLLPLAGAAIGSVVPGVGTALGASLGGALGGAIDSSKGSKKASKAQLAALEQARAIEGGAYNDVRDVQSPYLGFGGGAVNSLSGRLGITPTALPASNNALTGSPAAGTTKTPGGFAGTSPYPEPTAANAGIDTFGAAIAPSLSAAATAEGARPQVNALTGQPPATPGAAAGGADPGTYGNATNPTYTAPEAPAAYTAPSNFTYSLEDYKASPGYQFRQDQARKSILSSAGATGALQSGAALKELYDRGDQIAYQDYGTERAFAAGRSDSDRNFGYGVSRDARGDFVTDRNFGRDVYTDDRNYLSNRFDNQTNNLFKAAGVGQGAADTISNAASRYGDQAAGLVTDAGNVKANNALRQAQIGSDFASNLGGIVAGAFTSPKLSGAPTSNIGNTVNYGNALTSLYRY